ncbi:MAG: hypothetical protein AAF636_25715, partial [Pseudomonadota bacterium]
MLKTKFACAIAIAIATSAAQAQEQAPSTGISVELNTIGQVDGGCQLTFLTSSGYEQGVEQVVFETVL